MKKPVSDLVWLGRMAAIGFAAMMLILVITLAGCFNAEENGWTYFTTLPNHDKVYYKHFPEKKVTVYWTVRSVSVVKD